MQVVRLGATTSPRIKRAPVRGVMLQAFSPHACQHGVLNCKAVSPAHLAVNYIKPRAYGLMSDELVYHEEAELVGNCTPCPEAVSPLRELRRSTTVSGMPAPTSYHPLADFDCQKLSYQVPPQLCSAVCRRHGASTGPRIGYHQLKVLPHGTLSKGHCLNGKIYILELMLGLVSLQSNQMSKLDEML